MAFMLQAVTSTSQFLTPAVCHFRFGIALVTCPGLLCGKNSKRNFSQTSSLDLRMSLQLYQRELRHRSFGYYLGNAAFEAVDAEMLFGLIRLLKPRRVYEIGSGFSTLLAADALRRNRADGHSCRFIAIEPYPSAELEAELPRDVELWRVPVQEVPLDEFESLCQGDILFVDSSHVCKIGSDVQFEFLEVLPRIRPGVVVHIHDIFMPVEYPKQWVLDWHRFWNEQYLLQTFLSFNAAFEVLWAGQWMHINHPDLLMKAFPSYRAGVSPGSFWFRRTC